MRRGIALLFLEPAPQNATRFDDWLNDDLLPKLLSVPGAEFAQHFTARPDFLIFPAPPAETVVAVELRLDSQELAEIEKALGDLLTPARLPAVDFERSRVYLLEEFREEMRLDGLPEGFRERHPRDLLIFFLGAVPGREEEFHEWYDRAHIRDGLTLAGFATGQRFRAVPALLANSPAPSEFVAIYEVYGEDLDTAIKAAGESAGQHEQTDAADAPNMRAYALSSSGRVVRSGRPTTRP